MRSHVIAAGRWISDHRHQIAIATCLTILLAFLVCVAPILLALAIVESRQTHGRRLPRNRLCGLIALSFLANSVRWLWNELQGAPQRPWHPCAQCGRPIEAPSRAAYCSHECRTYARLQREALDSDPLIAERAARRLRNKRLRDLADNDPHLDEVPF